MLPKFTKYFLGCMLVLLYTLSYSYAQPDMARPDTVFTRKKISLKPTTDFDQRFSFINGEPVNIWGYRAGLLVNGKFKTGIGGYYLKQETAGLRTDREGSPIHKLTKQLYYGTVYYEPYLLRRKLWETSLVFELGFGSAVLDSTNKVRGKFVTTREKQLFVPSGAGISANLIMPDMKGLHFLTYFGLNGMIGVRKVLFDTDEKYNYDGWYWSIGGAIFIDRIFTDLKRKKQARDTGYGSIH